MKIAKFLSGLTLLLISAMSSLIADTNYTAHDEAEYATVFRLLEEQANHHRYTFEQIINKIEKDNLPTRCFLDIGAGPGTFTGMLAPYFEKTVAIEPNPVFRAFHNDEPWSVFAGSFEEYPSNSKVSLALCSHVLYHVQTEKWKPFVKKMLDTFEPNGLGAIVHLAIERDSVPIHSTFNPNYRHSRIIIHALQELGARFEVIPSCYEVRGTFDEIYQVCRFFVFENCFTPDELSALSPEEREHLEQRIKTFAKELKDESGDYVISWDEDLILFSSCDRKRDQA